MDDFPTHLAPYPRRFSAMPKILNIGYRPQKNTWIDNAFPTANFSFILSGHGQYGYGGQYWDVAAPCVITQWPAARLHYGPNDGETWEEFYVCFPGKCYKQFLKSGLMSEQRRMWPIVNQKRFMAALRGFWDLLKELDWADRVGWADRADIAIQSVIAESLLGAETNLDANDRAINDIRLKIEMNYLADHDFDELALDAGFSPSSFRRHWQRIVQVPPGRYVMSLRIARAQRYLIETGLCVADIAAKVSFDDQLYFSRKFKQFVGVCPTEYRQVNQMPNQ
ncbi:MAG: helix-turn-helix transcriptional regulator [Sedimentisphaerales bacterium]|nr:helix-turn-helix transcriptional regulator [Sedimentisphaerales bacterium]